MHTGKIKLSKRYITSHYPIIVRLGYSDLDFTLDEIGIKPYAYTMGDFGWNSDIYMINGGQIILSKGYRPFGQYKIPHKDIYRLECEALRVSCDIDRAMLVRHFFDILYKYTINK